MSFPDKYLTSAPRLDFFIGREDLLTRILYTLREEGGLVNLYGMGGIGKTTLAAGYARHPVYAGQYDWIVWVEWRSSVAESFVYQEELLQKLGVAEKVKGTLINSALNEEQRLQAGLNEMLDAIRALPGLLLLVIDNVDDETNLMQHKAQLFKINGHVIITSRVDIEDVSPIRVDALALDASRALFWRYYQRGNAAMSQENARLLDSLLDFLGHHTLLTEMLGKIAHKMAYSLEELYRYVHGLSLRDESWQVEVGTGINGHTHKVSKESIRNYMTLLFRDIQSIDERERNILRMFSVLPLKSYTTLELSEFFAIETLMLQKALSKLDSVGIPVRQGQIWMLHPLFREVCLAELKPFTATNCQPIINKILSPLKIRHHIRDPFYSVQYLPFGLEFLKYVEHHNMRMSELMINVAEIYHFLEDIPKAFYWINILFGRLSAEDMEVINNLNLAVLSGENVEWDVETWLLNPVQSVDVFALMGQLYYATGDLIEAKQNAELALEIARIIYFNSDGHAGALSNLAVILMDMDALSEAEALLMEALEIHKMNNSEGVHDLGHIYSNLGMLLSKQGKLAQARDFLVLSIEHYSNQLGHDHPELSITYSNLATVLTNLREYDAARQTLEKSIDIVTNAFGEESPGKLCIPYNNLGSLYRQIGDLEKAQFYMEKSYSLSVQAYGETSLKATRFGDLLAKFYWDLGWHEKARDLLAKCLKHVDPGLAAEHLFVASAYAKYGTLCHIFNDYPQSIKKLEISLRFEDTHPAIEFPEIAIWKFNLSMVLTKVGEGDKAQKLYHESHEIYKAIKQLQNPKDADIMKILGQNFDIETDEDS